MFNSTSLLLQRSCRDWELLSFFQTVPYHTQWHSIMDYSFLTLLISSFSLLLPLLLSFSTLLLPKLLWSLHDRNTTSLDRYVHNDQFEILNGEAETYACYYITNDDREDLVADIVGDGEDLLFLSVEQDKQSDALLVEQARTIDCFGDQDPVCSSESCVCDSPAAEEDLIIDITIEGTPPPTPSEEFHTPNASIDDGKEQDHVTCSIVPIQEDKAEEGEIGAIIVEGEVKVEAEKLQEQEEHLSETCTNGSTSKSSCEWRGSGNFRDSETDGFFSSSSRRSSSNWESYTMYRKYDEEMMFFDRISSQKLKETESLRSIKVQPRSFSERIVQKLNAKNRRRGCNPYHELEAAYVAQICLAWEAISWNYNLFRRRTSEWHKDDPGFPAQVAQQFQQFLVLLQRFIENEPYEYGRRPEVYARLRISSPKLLQVPEFHGGEMKDEFCSRIQSPEFLKIIEDIIRTFMIFLKADKERHWKALKALILNSKPSSVDRNMLSFIRKANKKKKAKLKDLQGGGNCLRKMKLKPEEEMEILMCLVDMKIVSRVLRMPEICEQHLHWCEEKMRKVRFCNGRAQRDSTPLFFPGQ